jgi:hypothetical protein
MIASKPVNFFHAFCVSITPIRCSHFPHPHGTVLVRVAESALAAGAADLHKSTQPLGEGAEMDFKTFVENRVGIPGARVMAGENLSLLEPSLGGGLGDDLVPCAFRPSQIASPWEHMTSMISQMEGAASGAPIQVKTGHIKHDDGGANIRPPRNQPSATGW